MRHEKSLCSLSECTAILTGSEYRSYTLRNKFLSMLKSPRLDAGTCRGCANNHATESPGNDGRAPLSSVDVGKVGNNKQESVGNTNSVGHGMLFKPVCDGAQYVLFGKNMSFCVFFALQDPRAEAGQTGNTSRVMNLFSTSFLSCVKIVVSQKLIPSSSIS